MIDLREEEKFGSAHSSDEVLFITRLSNGSAARRMRAEMEVRCKAILGMRIEQLLKKFQLDFARPEKASLD